MTWTLFFQILGLIAMLTFCGCLVIEQAKKQ